MPALPLDEAGKYVAAAYLVFLALILIYVAIMAVRLSNLERDVRELAELAERELADEPDREAVRSRDSAETVTSLQGEAR
jgi:predicted S18 family serine protease